MRAHQRKSHPGGWLSFYAVPATRADLSVGLASLVEVLKAEVGRFDVAFSTTAVKTLAFELVGNHATVLGLFHQGVGDLDLATLAWFGLLDQGEDVRGQDVTTDDRQVRRCIFRLRLLDHVAYAVQVVTDQVAGNHAVLVGFLGIDFLDRNDGAAILLVQLDHLGQDAVAFEVDAQVVRQYHGEGFVTDQWTAGQDRVTQAFHFGLTGVGERALVQQFADTDQVLFLVGALDLVFQLVADVEVVFQRAFTATGDDRDLGQAGIQRFLDAVLDQWLVHHRQHFLGHGFSRWEEASTVTGCWEQAFLDHISP